MELSPYDEEMSHQAAEWLDKIFKILLPPRVYSRAKHTSNEKYVRKWLLDHEIAIAQEEGTIAVIREGKVFAVWNPPVKPNPKTPCPNQNQTPTSN